MYLVKVGFLETIEYSINKIIMCIFTIYRIIYIFLEDVSERTGNDGWEQETTSTEDKIETIDVRI